ncbi:MAG: P1 family peptidase [Pseudomonadota bacterium]
MTLTDVKGILVGHATDVENHTGCTAILCPEGATAGVHVPGFAPGSRETELLHPLAQVEEIHGVLLTGGSAFGLAAATGTMRFLTEKGYGLPTLYARVPLVPAAVIYDLNFNQTLGKPDEEMGYRAAENASDRPVVQGCVGAGTGCTAGKLAGFDRAMKSGLGSFSLTLGEVRIGALVVANPMGAVVDAETGETLAGMLTPDRKAITPASRMIRDMAALMAPPPVSNTVLAVVAVDADLTRVQAARLARMASVGLARAIRPAHLLYDGDTVFALATRTGPTVDLNVLGALAAEATAQAAALAAKNAVGVEGYPAYADFRPKK